MKGYKDNREFIEALDAAGELVRIDQEVDWDLEAGAIVRKVCEEKAASPLMNKIKDYPGHRYLGAPIATYRKLAITLGMDPDSSIPQIAQEYVKRINQQPVKPVMVDKKQAPCKENIITGKDVDLFSLPAPMVHDGDGGRYLSTWHFVTTKDPDNGDVNWGMYRQMCYDSKTMTGPLLPFSDGGKVFHGKYRPRGQAMPFATVIGPDPLSAIAACAPSPIPESEYTGMLMGKPVELVKCETVDLEVPAHAEIVIEGEILPDVFLEEAPFGEYTGYRTSPRDLRTVYRVKAITYRNDPITTISNMGVPTDEGQLLRSFSLCLEMDMLLRAQGIPITGAYMWPESTHHLVVIGVKPIYSNIAAQIAQLVFGSKLGPWFHMVVVVDDQTDIYNNNEVIHALTTKCHPKKGIHIYEGAGTPLYPFLNLEERLKMAGPKVLFDCTFPIDWDPLSEVPRLVSFKTVYPKEIQEKVLANWENYGFKSK
ncbi:MAG: phenylphosphate carboxylase subunit alpha [Dethiobacter sp.]|jgi:4-hydroxy-3-polyprenylbenzoate decarboxylase|nr:MAG: phenylphosphate carboxylase subunit alpha [Dethiobacter sp.]